MIDIEHKLAKPIVLTARARRDFDEKWIAVPDEAGCWIWVCKIDKKGYGILWSNYETYRAHRVSYTIHVGEIPRDQLVRHTCDTPSCVNPSHLLLGSYADNNQDKVRRSRQARGSVSPASKITEGVARSIYLAPGSQRDVAELHGVCQSNVSLIKRGLLWKEATENLR